MFKSSPLKITALVLSLLCLTILFAACSDPESKQDDPSLTSEIAYDYDLSQFIKLGTYKGIEIGPYDPIVATAEEIQIEVDNILYYYQTVEYLTEGTLAEGDIANIDYVGRIDGEEFSGGSAEGHDLTLGSGSFIDGFESGLIGHDVGETVILNLSFPDDYGNEEYAGKAVEFEVTINGIAIYVYPEYTDEFVSTNFDEVSTIAELEAEIKSQILADKEAELKYTKMDDAWNSLTESSEITSFPQAEIERYVQDFVGYYTEEAAYYGLTIDEYVVEVGITMDEFYSTANDYAENSVASDLIMYSIVKAENIEISDDEYEPLLQEYVDNMSGYNTVAELEADYGKDALIYNLLWDKTYEYIVANAVEVG